MQEQLLVHEHRMISKIRKILDGDDVYTPAAQSPEKLPPVRDRVERARARVRRRGLEPPEGAETGLAVATGSRRARRRGAAAPEDGKEGGGDGVGEGGGEGGGE